MLRVYRVLVLKDELEECFAMAAPRDIDELIEQVVLANDTNAQADAKSAISGTGQVASYDGRFVVFF